MRFSHQSRLSLYLVPTGHKFVMPFTLKPPHAASAWRLQARTSRPCRVRCTCEAQPEVLERFWRARGVSDEAHVARLVKCGLDTAAEGRPSVTGSTAAAWDPGEPLPGVNTFWQLDRSTTAAAQVQAVSARLLELHSLLGSRADISVADMLIREPRLLTAELPDIASQLVAMRMAEGAQSLDIGKVVEAQPALLLQEFGSQQSPEAWSFGLSGDDEQQWAAWLAQLSAYRAQWGDCHVGHRADEPPGLAKGARMHRAAFKRGTLAPDRVEALQALGFCWDAEEAEWRFMFERFQASQRQLATAAHSAALPAADDFLLTNWCSVQRIAARSGVLSAERRALLEAAGIDWTGADALS